ncbi:MAG: beta-eliminating lyase-related protein [Pseudomonadota bacterium]
MDFSSDTSAPAHPKVIEALAAANTGNAASYGNDAVSAVLRDRLSETFETDDFDFWLTASGTAANALALSCVCPPIGSILCHREAHIERDERGAPEFFTGGGKLQLLPGESGKIDETALRDALSNIDHGFVHETPPYVLSLTNLTECGTAYSPEHIQHFAALGHSAGLTVHLDGARFANALLSTNTSPAQMSWQAGIDILTLGLTKTGAMGCEIIVLFGDARRHFPALKARAKRSGHMPPKMRFLAAQGLALLTNDLWLDLAGQANRFARDLSNTLCKHPGVQLAFPVDGNEVFATLPDGLEQHLSKAGATFYPWPGGHHRFVCSWATQKAEIDQLSHAISRR